MKKLVLGLFVVVIVFITVVVYEMFWSPNIFEGERIVTVSRGDTFEQIMDSLEHKGAIQSRLLLSFAAKFLDEPRSIKIGRYRFLSGKSNMDYLEDLNNGYSIIPIAVVLPEGIRITRHARILKRDLGIDSARYVGLTRDSAFIRSLGVTAASLEGYLMPSTYQFNWQTEEEDILRTMVRTFRNELDDSLLLRAKEIGLSLHQVITLASIIEGETRLDSERATVSGVYHNRLKKGIRLQADPTIQYTLEDGPRRLRHSDLKRESLYNTYLYRGLPPGPINNPGRQAILAALYPEQHHYLYFVATGGGGHTFTRSYDEHLRAAKRYHRLLNKRNESKNSL